MLNVFDFFLFGHLDEGTFAATHWYVVLLLLFFYFFSRLSAALVAIFCCYPYSYSPFPKNTLLFFFHFISKKKKTLLHPLLHLSFTYRWAFKNVLCWFVRSSSMLSSLYIQDTLFSSTLTNFLFVILLGQAFLRSTLLWRSIFSLLRYIREKMDPNKSVT